MKSRASQDLRHFLFGMEPARKTALRFCCILRLCKPPANRRANQHPPFTEDCGAPKPPSGRIMPSAKSWEVAANGRRRESAYKSRRRRTNFLIPKKKTPHPQTKGRGALHSTRCHPNSVFFIKTALFLSVTWTNPGLSAMTPFGRHSHFHPSQFRSQPARNERTKPLFASGNNPLRRSTSFLSFFRRFSLCFAQPEAVHQIYQCLALQVCTNAAGATSLTVRGYTQTNSIKTIIWDLQYFSNPDHRAPVHGSVPRR